ncbi:MAG: leucine-rich repeat domain-containing protein [Acetivibrionales bacterium]|nr:hypothetical protein [Clostridiaceae bacterium]
MQVWERCSLYLAFQAQAAPIPPQIPTSIPTLDPDTPTLQPINADISGEFTDPIFKQAVWEWLGKSGEPGAFSLSDIQNRIRDGNTRLTAAYRNISSLKGLEYFEGITHLTCSNNKLTGFPPLPSTLQSLYCANNQLTTLSDLPVGLRYLDCGYNQLTTLFRDFRKSFRSFHGKPIIGGYIA